MELYQLRTFVKVAEEGNLTRAAAQLFTSQPAISAQIKALEEDLGLALFERAPRGMRLTAKGELLYRQALATLDAAGDLLSEARRLQNEVIGEARIGIHTDFDFIRVGGLAGALAERHPGLRPHFVQSMSAQILPDIRNGRLDAGFFFGPCRQAGLSVLHLACVPMQVVGPRAWNDRLGGADKASLAALPWVYTSDSCPFFAVMNELLLDARVEPRKVAYVDSEDAVRELIRSGAGLSILRRDDAQRMLAADEVSCWDGDVPRIDLGFACDKQRSGEPMIQALLELVREYWPESAVAGRARDQGA